MSRFRVLDQYCARAAYGISFVILILGALAETSWASPVINFEDLSLTPNSYWNGSDGSGGFTSGGAYFNNGYDPTYGDWSGWAYSNVSNTTTGDYSNQYAAYTGSGVGGSGTYAVAYVGDPAYGVAPTITIPSGMHVQSAMFTNTTYAAITMLDGSSYSKQFGPDDWFLLTITGEGASNNVLGSVDFYLAENGSILNTWQQVDLSSLSAATTLEFNLTSSNTGLYGMNTPAYFAMDNLTLSPAHRAIGLRSDRSRRVGGHWLVPLRTTLERPAWAALSRQSIPGRIGPSCPRPLGFKVP